MAKDKSEIVYTPSEVYGILSKMIIANDIIMAKGGVPVSMSVVGSPGLGKTTVCRELAADLGRGFYKLNLAQLTEPSELIGYYSKEYEMVKDKTHVWVTENMIPEYLSKGFSYTEKTKTKPCPPDWVVNLTPNSILCLDDYSRSNSLFSQAIMELVNEGTMVGWDLKEKNIQILLTENPDDGEYNVSSMDKAQGDRMMRVTMKWDAQDWASRAEKLKLDERLINFVLWMPELLENKKKDGISASDSVSPRMMDKFFSLVSTIPDFEKHLDQIVLFGSISVGPNVTSNLTNFINKKLDKLPSIEDLIINDDLATAKKKLTACCGDSEKDPENWKSATAAILTTRLYNYMRYNHDKIKKANIQQYLGLLLHTSFGLDQKYLMVKQTVGLSNQFSQLLAGDPAFIKYMTK
jgi:MoxR-like ATPase